jgi:hypothetical protein
MSACAVRVRAAVFCSSPIASWRFLTWKKGGRVSRRNRLCSSSAQTAAKPPLKQAQVRVHEQQVLELFWQKLGLQAVSHNGAYSGRGRGENKSDLCAEAWYPPRGIT